MFLVEPTCIQLIFLLFIAPYDIIVYILYTGIYICYPITTIVLRNIIILLLFAVIINMYNNKEYRCIDLYVFELSGVYKEPGNGQ